MPEYEPLDYEQMAFKNQFDVASDFAEDVNAEFTNARDDTTRHSLGVALTTYSGVMSSYEGESFVRNTTTYAAPKEKMEKHLNSLSDADDNWEAHINNFGIASWITRLFR